MTSSASNPVNLGFSPEASPAPSSSAPSKRRRLSDSNEDREARKEARAAARAQRNRLAAQESRDRRKREFAELHSRVAELEAENAALRESKPGAVFGNERTERLERENAELLERVSRLESALTSVMPLIQGSRSSSVVAPSMTSGSSSPIPSLNSSLLAPVTPEPSVDSTRHLARVATVPSPSLDVKVTPQQRVVSSQTISCSPAPSLIPPTTTSPIRHPLRPSPLPRTISRSWIPISGYTPLTKQKLLKAPLGRPNSVRLQRRQTSTLSWVLIIPPILPHCHPPRLKRRPRPRLRRL